MATVRCLGSEIGRSFAAYRGDCVDVLAQLPESSVGLAVYSPPFANLYVYSDSVADMGNCRGLDEFETHYAHALDGIMRVMMPGRLVAVHCSEIPLQKWRDGVIGLVDFPGRLIACHERAGFVFHSRVTIWKDPVVEMQRTKALGLLHKQLLKDACMSRVGMPDYLLVFRKPGENPQPVSSDRSGFPVERWQQWASPVWMDIQQTEVLHGREARDPADEKHVCPLQLGVIRRAVSLWSNTGDVVLSPFMGIGSEGYVALGAGRRFVGIELKESYYRQAVGYLQSIDRQTTLTAAGM